HARRRSRPGAGAGGPGLHGGHPALHHRAVLPHTARGPPARVEHRATPLQVLGHIAGAPDVLSYPEDVYRYMRAVAEASDRVKVFSIGETEEGREMILVVVADERTIAELDRYKDMLARLSD